MTATTKQFAIAPLVERVKLEPKRRRVVVKEKIQVTPKSIRIKFQGEDLADFRSPSPDDHIKIFLTAADGSEVKRDYTPLRFDVQARTLELEFLQHPGSAVSTWVEQAMPGDPLLIGGPRGSTLMSSPGAWWVLIADETAIPSVTRRLEEMEEGTRAIAVIAVTGPEEERMFATEADLSVHWVHRPEEQAGDPAPVLDAIRALAIPEGHGFVWIGTEEEVARAARTYFIETAGHPTEWVKAKAYWSFKPARKTKEDTVEE